MNPIRSSAFLITDNTFEGSLYKNKNSFSHFFPFIEINNIINHTASKSLGISAGILITRKQESYYLISSIINKYPVWSFTS